MYGINGIYMYGIIYGINGINHRNIYIYSAEYYVVGYRIYFSVVFTCPIY